MPNPMQLFGNILGKAQLEGTGCWRQFKDWFNYRLIEDLDALKQSLREAVAEIQEPTLWNYLCP